MKTRINNVKKGVVTLLFAAVIAGLTACETDPVKSQRGELPDKDLLENTYVKIRSIKSPTEFAVVNLSEGTTVTEDRIYCRLTRPAERAFRKGALPQAPFRSPRAARSGNPRPAR